MAGIWTLLFVGLFFQPIRSSSVLLTVDPNKIPVGPEPEPLLNITCVYTGSEALSTLSIDKEVNGRKTRFVSVNSTGVTEFSFLPDDATTDGSLDRVSISIPNPGGSFLGTYYCRPVTVSGAIVRAVSNQVCEAPSNMSVLDEKLSNVSSVLDQVELELETIEEPPEQLNFTVELLALIQRSEDLQADFSVTMDDLAEIQMDVDDIVCEVNSTLDLMENQNSGLFVESPMDLAGTRYLISQFTPASFVNAYQICQDQKGYLAEIDTEEEFEFLQIFLRQFMNQHQQLVISLLFDGIFDIHRYSRNEFEFGNYFAFNLVPENPDLNYAEGVDVFEECISMVYNWRDAEPRIAVWGITCDHLIRTREEYFHGFICEIPPTPPTPQPDYLIDFLAGNFAPPPAPPVFPPAFGK